MAKLSGSMDAVALQHKRQTAFRETEGGGVPSVIGAPASIDAWRHLRMYEPLTPLVQPGTSWLTIGDSGADAHWLQARGAGSVVASSITDLHLRELQERDHLAGLKVAAVNAEQIAFDDASFDFVLCKEAFHHFARPMVGFYEMLRVARLGAVLLAEPNGDGKRRPLDIVKRGIKYVLRKGSDLANDKFESSGNFIYGPSLFEIWKAATALQYRHLYYLRLNDFFHGKLARRPRSDRLAWQITRLGISAQDMAAHLGLMSWGSTTIILFKDAPPEAQAKALVKAGFRAWEVPQNPYL